MEDRLEKAKEVNQFKRNFCECNAHRTMILSEVLMLDCAILKRPFFTNKVFVRPKFYTHYHYYMPLLWNQF